MRRVIAVLGLACSAVFTVACFERPQEFGVSVFSADTMPVTFTLYVQGSLVMGLRSQGFKMRPDKSLIMITPAQLIVQKGEGSASIQSVSGGRIVVQPLGVSPDSADTSSAEGLSIGLVRTGEHRSVKLTVEKKEGPVTRSPAPRAKTPRVSARR